VCILVFPEGVFGLIVVNIYKSHDVLAFTRAFFRVNIGSLSRVLCFTKRVRDNG
jgi:hypothetical protein